MHVIDALKVGIKRRLSEAAIEWIREMKRIPRDLLFGMLRLRWRLPSGLELEINNYSEWCTYNDLFVDGDYDSAIRDALNRIREEGGGVVLDLGANVGFFAMRLLDQYVRGHSSEDVRLYLVEASPQNVAELRRRMKAVVLSRVRMEIIAGLAGRLSGTESFFQSRFHIGNRIVRKAGPFSVPVSYVNLNECLAGEARLALAKIDIEGAEQIFLENYTALLQMTDAVVIEIHHEMVDLDQVLAGLKSLGFEKFVEIRNLGPMSLHYCTRPEAATRSPAGDPKPAVSSAT